MSLVKGPFDLTWGANTLADVEEIGVEHDHDEEDYQTVQHLTRTIDGAVKTTVELTLLASDIAALAAVLPQYHVPQGGTMSTGETVANAAGAIDYKASCDDEVYNDLDIASCGDPEEVVRLVNARTKLSGLDIDGKVRKVMIKFIGEPADDEASLQFFREGPLGGIS